MKLGKGMLLIVLAPVLLAWSTFGQDGPIQGKPGPFQFELSFSSAVHPGPITGRVYVIVAKDGGVEPHLGKKRPGPQTGGGDRH
jgi:hypothetical protein